MAEAGDVVREETQVQGAVALLQQLTERNIDVTQHAHLAPLRKHVMRFLQQQPWSKARRFASKQERKEERRAMRKRRRIEDQVLVENTALHRLRQNLVRRAVAHNSSLLSHGSAPRGWKSGAAELPQLVLPEGTSAEPSALLTLDAQAMSQAAPQAGECKEDHIEEEPQRGNKGEEGGSPRRLHRPRRCYVCKQHFHVVHHFYASLCPPCAALNWRKRQQEADMRGRVALVTGARIKIGHHVALKLLRAGARVLITTRFPSNALRRFASLSDYATWRERLEVYAVDFTDLAAVQAFAADVKTRHARLDILVNSAAQTVKRPREFYTALLQDENLEELPREDVARVRGRLAMAQHEGKAYTVAASALHAATVNAPSAEASTAQGREGLLQRLLGASAANAAGPREGEEGAEVLQRALTSLGGAVAGDPTWTLFALRDAAGQPVDLRPRNSWSQSLLDTPVAEVLEAYIINAVAPFILIATLAPHMATRPIPSSMRQPVTAVAPEEARFIVNVSAAEGVFHAIKSPLHPHLNMAKAALNMLTRTSAVQLARAGVFMTAVDTGWVSDSMPLQRAAKKPAGFQPPIDEADAAARILDPVFQPLLACATKDDDGGDVRVDAPFGVYLKDYAPHPW